MKIAGWSQIGHAVRSVFDLDTLASDELPEALLVNAQLPTDPYRTPVWTYDRDHLELTPKDVFNSRLPGEIPQHGKVRIENQFNPSSYDILSDWSVYYGNVTREGEILTFTPTDFNINRMWLKQIFTFSTGELLLGGWQFCFDIRLVAPELGKEISAEVGCLKADGSGWGGSVAIIPLSTEWQRVRVTIYIKDISYVKRVCHLTTWGLSDNSKVPQYGIQLRRPQVSRLQGGLAVPFDYTAGETSYKSGASGVKYSRTRVRTVTSGALVTLNHSPIVSIDTDDILGIRPEPGGTRHTDYNATRNNCTREDIGEYEHNLVYRYRASGSYAYFYFNTVNGINHVVCVFNPETARIGFATNGPWGTSDARLNNDLETWTYFSTPRPCIAKIMRLPVNGDTRLYVAYWWCDVYSNDGWGNQIRLITPNGDLQTNSSHTIKVYKAELTNVPWAGLPAGYRNANVTRSGERYYLGQLDLTDPFTIFLELYRPFTEPKISTWSYRSDLITCGSAAIYLRDDKLHIALGSNTLSVDCIQIGVVGLVVRVWRGMVDVWIDGVKLINNQPIGVPLYGPAQQWELGGPNHPIPFTRKCRIWSGALLDSECAEIS